VEGRLALAADSGRITGKPEVIGSSVGLVPINGLRGDQMDDLLEDFWPGVGLF
jgi:hypothetical protein